MLAYLLFVPPESSTHAKQYVNYYRWLGRNLKNHANIMDLSYCTENVGPIMAGKAILIRL